MSDSRQHDRQSGCQHRGRLDGAAPREAGFTLVEILVAFFITAILSLAIYSLFSTTASSLKEADSLASTLDGSRFALERLRSDLQSAGALGTPDMYNDTCQNAIPPCVAPNPPIPDRRVVGLASYGNATSSSDNPTVGTNWQNYAQDIIPKEIRRADGNQGSESWQRPQFDGIVVMGAIDLPYTFELGFQGQGDQRTPTVFPDQRGLWKLLRNDIFDTTIQEPNLSDSEVTRAIKGGGVGQYRLLRVMDLTGRLQFAGIADNSSSGGDAITTNGTNGNMTITLDGQYDFFTTDEANRETDYGLDPESQQDDKRYPAAFLDAYWYHVIPDPTQPEDSETNYMLVRDRLDATQVMQNLTGNDWTGYNPARDRPNNGGRVVLADRVVDFRIWFDCADSQGRVTDSSWNVGWAPPDGTSDADHNCLDPSSPAPGEARIMHVRLSRRTETEREELPANAFPQGTEHMQAFDLDPDFKGAARVYTSQIDFEIPTFASRNITEESD